MIKSHRKQTKKKSWKIKLGETGISLYIPFPAANLSFSAKIKLFVISVSFTMHMGFFCCSVLHLFYYKPYVMRFAATENVCLFRQWYFVCLLGTCVTFSTQSTLLCMHVLRGIFFLRESYIHFRFTFLSYLVVFILGWQNQQNARHSTVVFVVFGTIVCLPFHLMCFIRIYLHSSRTSFHFEL